MGRRTPDSCFIRTEYPKGIRTHCSYDIRIPDLKSIRTEYPNVIRTEELWIPEILHDDSNLPRTQVAALLEGHRQLFEG
mgnify:CR=1 FL=1